MRLEKDVEIQKILKIMCPGTAIREGLENILRAKTGGLIVLSDSDEIMKMADGGFAINSEYTAAYVYELAKMDGAIIVSKDLKKIVSANIQLLPDASIPTFETGTRHRTAHRVAKQTGDIVVAISQRRNMITVYKGDIRYVLRESSVILEKANQAIQTLEKYVAVLDRVINNLNLLEFQDLTTLFDVATAIQRTEMVMRIVEEIKMYILELGNEGRLVSMQLNELVKHIERDGILLIKDYIKEGYEADEVYTDIQKLTQTELLDLEAISKVIGYGSESLVETLISPKGYRMLSKVPRIPANVIENLINQFKDLTSIIDAEIEDLDKVEGIGEARAKAIRSGLKRINEQVYLNKQL
ncbi:MAG: DNA integrity scanning diadenylate cyclase DisA [Clostridiaceae bacterium]|nr:DNA integrity scanning diadenylate cyclase DisA [Clostridiaceae bacterium]